MIEKGAKANWGWGVCGLRCEGLILSEINNLIGSACKNNNQLKTKGLTKCCVALSCHIRHRIAISIVYGVGRVVY